MDISQYRRSFAEYNRTNELIHFQHRAGLRSDLPLEDLLDQYADLFTAESIEALAGILEKTKPEFETERSALKSLLNSARIGFLEHSARALINEKWECSTSARFNWDGVTISANQTPRLIANEPNAARRSELLVRQGDALGACDDLRSECFLKYQESAKTLGFNSYQSLFEDVMQIGFGGLQQKATDFLISTEGVYLDGLKREFLKNDLGVDISEASFADFLYLQRMPAYTKHFPSSAMLRVYRAALAGLGLSVEKMTNIQMDIEIRPGKNPRAACFRVNPPFDVRLSVSPIGGPHDYTVLFHEAGHAQHFAWSSQSLVERYPEFLFAPENATSESFAFLFSHLFHDPNWIMECGPGLKLEDARDAARSFAFLTLSTIRRYCAKLEYELGLHANANPRSAELAFRYADLQKQATRFVRPSSMYLFDVDDGFYAAAYLRAWAFEASLREYLRTRHGRRWWASKKAGDELVDLWNTSSQYTVDELSRLIGFSDSNFDLLAEQLSASVKGM